jgi:hypothetical protein
MIVKITLAEAQAALNALVACGGNKAAAARSIKKKVTTYKRHLEAAHDMGLKPGVIPPAPENAALGEIIEGLRSELDRTREALAKATKPHFTVRQDNRGETDTYRVLVMGDAHDDPKIPDKSRFEWAGKYCAEHKHDVLLSIGDFLNLNSLCFHVPDETFHGKAKPTYMQDIESGMEAFAAINSGLGNWKPEKHKTVGNHENRLYRTEDKQPASWGMYQALYDEMMTGAGFTYSPYGAHHLIGGVAFTHVPLTIMGKPYSGRHLNTMGNDSIRDMVIGHRHRAAKHPFAKLDRQTVTIVDSGCFLPWGHTEDFSEHTPGLWDYCLTDIRIKNRKIVDVNFVSLLTLEERYGKA